MVLFGAQAVGAVAWGGVAEVFGVVVAFFAAAAAMLGVTATIRWWPLIETAGMDRSTSAHWPQPHLVFDVEGDTGPVLVKTVYTIAPEREKAFLEAMEKVRLSRQRTGSTHWRLYRDGETPHTSSCRRCRPGTSTSASTAIARPAPTSTMRPRLTRCRTRLLTCHT